jgi:hypothetical protein
MRKDANTLHMQPSEVEEKPVPKCFALKNLQGTWTFQTPYREPQVNDARAWLPSSEAVATEWIATVPINLPLQLFIGGSSVCTAARISGALELREVDIRDDREEWRTAMEPGIHKVHRLSD